MSTDICGYTKAWTGPCRGPATDFGRCAAHAGAVCAPCGQPATHGCDHTGVQFVCGSALCDGCGHSAPTPGEPLGWFNLGGGHAPKPEAYQAWEAFYSARETPR